MLRFRFRLLVAVIALGLLALLGFTLHQRRQYVTAYRNSLRVTEEMRMSQVRALMGQPVVTSASEEPDGRIRVTDEFADAWGASEPVMVEYDATTNRVVRVMGDRPGEVPGQHAKP